MRLLSLNVQCGGMNGYDRLASYPVRMNQIKEAVHQIGADAVSLVDTYRWREIFGDAGVREEFSEVGYADARCIDLDDPDLDGKLGVTILSKEPMSNVRIINMAGRNALAATVSKGEEKLGLVSAYLTYDGEDERVKQAEGLIAGLNPDDVAAMDRNGVERGWPKNAGSLLNEMLMSTVSALPKMNKLHRQAADMGRGKVMRTFGAAGLAGANVYRRPTARLRGISVLPVDDFMHDPEYIKLSGFRVHGRGVFRAFDHRGISVEARRTTRQLPGSVPARRQPNSGLR